MLFHECQRQGSLGLLYTLALTGRDQRPETSFVSLSSYCHLLAPFPPITRGKPFSMQLTNGHNLWETVQSRGEHSTSLRGPFQEKGLPLWQEVYLWVVMMRTETLGLYIFYQKSYFQKIEKCSFLPPTFSSKNESKLLRLPLYLGPFPQQEFLHNSQINWLCYIFWECIDYLIVKEKRKFKNWKICMLPVYKRLTIWHHECTNFLWIIHLINCMLCEFYLHEKMLTNT